MRVFALVNPRARWVAFETGRHWKARIASAFAAAGVEATIASIRDVSPEAALARAREMGADALVAGGGDGTIGSVAGALVGTSMPLGVLPVGTLNHFSKDLGIPTSLEAAVRVIAAGNVAAIDVGEVNGRTFVNNSSIGLYPRLVRRRDKMMGHRGWGKWTAALLAAASVLRRFPLFDTEIEIDQVTIERHTPFVFVGNNAYTIEPFRAGMRSRLDGGTLSVYLPLSPTRPAMLRLAVRAVLGLLREGRDFESVTAPELTVTTRRRRVHVAADGEVWKTHPPLRYRTRPGELRVLVPPTAGA